MPTRMEPPRWRRRPVEKKVEPSDKVSMNETESRVELPGVAEVTTKLVPAIIGPSPSVVGSMQRPEEAGIVPQEVGECRQPAHEVVVACARLAHVEQGPILVDWSERIMMPWKAPVVRRSGMRIGMWGLPLEHHAGSSAR